MKRSQYSLYPDQYKKFFVSRNSICLPWGCKQTQIGGHRQETTGYAIVCVCVCVHLCKIEVMIIDLTNNNISRGLGAWLCVKSSYSSCRVPDSVHSTHTGRVKTAYNSSSNGSNALFWTPRSLVYTHIHVHTQNKKKINPTKRTMLLPLMLNWRRLLKFL